LSAYNWLRDGLIPAAGALAEALCLFAWLALAPILIDALDPLAQLPAPPFNFGWVWLLLAAPPLAGRLLDVAVPRHTARRWSLAGLSFVLFALFIQTQALGSAHVPDWRTAGDVLFPWAVEPAAMASHVAIYWFSAVLLLARGLWLAASEYDSGAARGWFVGWLLALFVLCLLSSAGGAPTSSLAALGLIAAVYFSVGLAWLTLVRRMEMEEDAFLRPGAQFTWTWLAIMLTGAVAMLAVAAALTGLQGAVRASARAIIPAVMLLWPILGAVVVWPAHVMWFDVIQPLLSLLPRDLLMAVANDQPEAIPTPAPGQLNVPPMALPPHLAEWTLLVVIVVCIVALFRWRVAAVRDARPPAAPQVHVALWSWRSFLARLVQLLSAAPAVSAPKAKQPPAQERAPMSVRLVYRAVLLWCQDRHRPRPAGATPLEFEGELGQLLTPELAQQLTRTYVRIRYANQPEDPASAEQLLEAWRAARHMAASPPSSSSSSSSTSRF